MDLQKADLQEADLRTAKNLTVEQLSTVKTLYRSKLDSPLEEVQQIRQGLQQSPLRPYQAFGTGRGLDANGRYIGVVLVHTNEELAGENAVLLRQRRVQLDSSPIHPRPAPMFG